MVKRVLSVQPRSSPVPAVDGVDFESIADSIPHMVWVAAPNGSTEYFNRWGTIFTGRPVEAHYGCGWLSLIYPDDADRARSEWELAVATETGLDAEWRVRRADGEYRRFAVCGTAVRDASGNVMKWMVTCTDVEHSRRLEADLRRSEQDTAESLALLEALQASAPVGFAFIDREFRIVHINATLAAINGGAIADQIGCTVAEVIPEIWPELDAVYQRVLETGVPIVGREIVGPSAGAGGSLRHWLSSFHPVRIDSEIVGIEVVMVDVTERKEAEEFRSAVMDKWPKGSTPSTDRAV